jgi:uncharacterized repeat protein (TIGR01451 family)
MKTSKRKLRSFRKKIGRGVWASLHGIVAIMMIMQTSMISGAFTTKTALATSDGLSGGWISGTVYEDHNGDGTRDPGDQSLVGITVQLTNGLNATTDADGNYTIYGVPAGMHSVVEFIPSGWVGTGTNTSAVMGVDVADGAGTEHIDFGNFKKTSISGTKFHDLNGDGVWDKEPGKSGVKIVLQYFDLYYFNHTEEYGINDGYLNQDETATEADGSFIFSNLGPGKYRLIEEVPTGWTQTYPESGMYNNIVLPSGQPVTNRDFGNYQPEIPVPTVTVHKKVDTNGNGKWDDTVDGGDAKGNAIGFRWGYATMDSSQTEKFLTPISTNDRLFGTSLAAQERLRITENSVDGYHYVGWYYSDEGNCSQPNEGWPMVYPKDGNISITLCNARDTGTIQGHKWVDQNGNGVWDQGEPTKSGVYIQTVHGQGATTDENGFYQITNVPTGNESVVEFTPTGWVNTNYNNAAVDVHVTAGDPVTVNFGNYELSSIHGMKYNDLNHNGVRDEGENGLANWTIQLEKFDDYYFNHTEVYGVNDGYLVVETETPTLTDANGHYAFSNLLPGKYRVSEVQQAGWTQSAPSGGVYTDLAPQSGEQLIGKDFGNWQNPDVTIITNSSTTLQITKSNNIPTFTNPGQNVTYTVNVKNVGTVGATHVVMSDVLPVGFSFTVGGGQTKAFAIGDLLPGQSVSQIYSASIATGVAAGNYVNVATATADNAATVSATSTVAVRTGGVLGDSSERLLQVKKSADQASVIGDSNVTYTVSVMNGGSADLEQVVVTDTLPDGATFTDGQNQRQWTIPLLSAGQQQDFVYTIHIPASQPRGSFTNQVVALANFIDPVETSVTISVRTPSVLGLATTGISTRDRVLFALSFSISALGFGLMQKRKLRVS